MLHAKMKASVLVGTVTTALVLRMPQILALTLQMAIIVMATLANLDLTAIIRAATTIVVDSLNS